MPPRSSFSDRDAKVEESRALLLRSVPQGDSSAIATYFTERHGKVAFVLRAVRQSKKRMPLALEPFHTLTLRYKPRPTSDLWSLETADVERARLELSADLDVSFAAGAYLRWLFALLPQRQPDTDLFDEAQMQLERLAQHGGAAAWQIHAGVRLLAHAGYELELASCVACHRPRPATRRALASAEHGGIVCRACATGETSAPVYAPFVLEPAVLALLSGTDVVPPTSKELQGAKDFLEAALAAHADIAM